MSTASLTSDAAGENGAHAGVPSDLAEARRRRVTLRFGACELDPRRFELRRSGERVPLAPQPFDLLWMLASRRGEIVRRDEIRQALWKAGTFVEFDGCVNYSVRELRRALGDDAKRPRFIEAVRGCGYRFVAPVDALFGDADGET